MPDEPKQEIQTVQRGPGGRIKKGSKNNPKGNNGDSDIRKAIEWKKKFYSCVTTEDVREVVDKLKSEAKLGIKWAVIEFLNRTLGKVAENVDVKHDHGDVPVQLRLYKVMNILGIPTETLPDRFLDEADHSAEGKRQHALPAPNALPAPVAPMPQEVHGMGEEPSSGGDLDGRTVEREEETDEQD